LITTLLVLAILSVFCLGLSRQVRMHGAIAEYDRDDARVNRLLDDGAGYAKYVLESRPAQAFPYTFVPVEEGLLDLTDNENIGLFIVEVGGKLNVNEVGRRVLEDILRQVVGVDSVAQDLAANIGDWLDSDPVGDAEADYYRALSLPYAPRNGAARRLEELLYVKGMMPLYFWGEDANHNLVLDPNENDGDASYPPDNTDGLLQFGLCDYLTAFESDGLNINSAPVHVWEVVLRCVLDADAHRAPVLAERIRAYRSGGDRVLGTPDDQRFESVDALGSVLGGDGEELVQRIQELCPLVVEPFGYEVTVRAALRDEHIARSCKLVLKLEDDSLLTMSYQEL